MERPFLVYTHPARYYFVAKDIELLSAHFSVIEHSFNSGSSLLLPWDLLRQLLFLLSAKRTGAEVAIVHFAGWHSVLPVLLGFRTFIIVAGSDSCSFPKIDYGSFRKRGMRWAMSYSMRRAERILPVHSSLEKFTNTYSDVGPQEQGYAHFINDLRTLSTPIEYGFDPDLWVPSQKPRDPFSILCIATGASYGNTIHLRKGVDLLMEAAKALPQVKFTVIGTNAASYQHTPSNIKFLGRIEPERLREHFATHSLYAQVSIMEGFPNALCEAMLMGCIPIGSNMTSIPGIIGSSGKIIAKRNVDLLVKAIEGILSLPESEITRLRSSARQQVIGYTLSERSRRLLDVMGIS